MHILLPPSEKKATDGDGPPLDLASLSFPGLTQARERVLAALDEACRRDDAPDVLNLPAGQVAEALARNKALHEAPALPAARLYTGVLYDNLDLADLDAEAAAEQIIVFSGLWGALRLTDRVPPYRLAMAVSLPSEGRLGALWRPAMREALRLDDDLIVDMRSGPYASAWKPPRPAVAVRVFRERLVGGAPERTVVSHMAKATRGRIAHDLLKTGASPRTPEELQKAVADLGHTAELNGTDLDVILHD
ncbi:peroxide stress protein YaaA [Actinomadura darangshiensis]|uniref:Peroxide stress protein YaaA n=1 Tax=Actinomadura darangshiensis TaxID=705336 RepID=A0A4R5BH50_9ACTN|nr:peroxide stress protein YaaA [Actinomadura darangshiensis]TDD84769.1 peroxide stress protein YaaA [Actinomadura darangshiensis]